MALETSSLLHILFELLIRELLKREGSGDIDIHSIGVLCFGMVVASVLGGSRVSSSWSNDNELEMLSLCSGGFFASLPYSWEWSPSLGKLDISQGGVLS